MDVLSDVLRVVRLSGAVFFTAEFSSPWRISSPRAQVLTQILMPGAESISLFHVLTNGECWVGYEGIGPVKMNRGDVIVFPRAKRHFMGSTLEGKSTPITDIVPLSRPTAVQRIRYGGGGEVSSFVCGYLQCEQRFNPLMGTLSEMIHIRRRESDAWLDLTLKRTIEEAESSKSGSSAMLSRLVELLFVDVLRRHMATMSQEAAGWLAGLRDPSVGHSLELLHSDPSRGWTVEILAREVGTSRSLLADRFSQLIGTSPMRYLTNWRIQLARFYLLEERLSICQVAQLVGYDSEAAFNRAFKRVVGAPPAAWRRGRIEFESPAPPRRSNRK